MNRFVFKHFKFLWNAIQILIFSSISCVSVVVLCVIFLGVIYANTWWLCDQHMTSALVLQFSFSQEDIIGSFACEWHSWEQELDGAAQEGFCATLCGFPFSSSWASREDGPQASGAGVRHFLPAGEGDDECKAAVHLQCHRMMVLDREEVVENSPPCLPSTDRPLLARGYGRDRQNLSPWSNCSFTVSASCSSSRNWVWILIYIILTA